MFGLFSWRISLYVIALISLDMTMAPLLRVGGAQFMLSYLFIVYVAFQWGWQKAIPVAFLVGLSRDFISSQVFGLETLALVYAAYLLNLIVQKMERSRMLLRMVVAFYFTSLAFIINILSATFVMENVRMSWNYVSVALGSALYTAVLLPVFFYISSKWFNDTVSIKQYELFS